MSEAATVIPGYSSGAEDVIAAHAFADAGDRLVKKSALWRRTPATLGAHLDGRAWTPYYYLVFIAEIIAALLRKGGARIVINTPPRHGKTKLVAQHTSTWFLAEHPDKDVILTSHEAMLATKSGRAIRNTIAEHSDALGLSLSRESV